MVFIIGIIIGISVCLIGLWIYVLVKGSSNVIDYNKVKYGSIKIGVDYTSYTDWRYGEKKFGELICKVRFVQYLGGGNIQVKYEDVFNIDYCDKPNCLKLLNDKYSCVKGKNVGWIDEEYGLEILFTKSDFFNMLKGSTLIRRGERYRLSEKISPSDLLNYITEV